MSIQGTKKPVFTKVMLGYAPREVDGYIERMNARYAAAVKDISRMKRRLDQMRVELDRVRASAAHADAEKLRLLFEEEKRRHAAALDTILDSLDGADVLAEGIAETDDGFVPLDDVSDGLADGLAAAAPDGEPSSFSPCAPLGELTIEDILRDELHAHRLPEQSLDDTAPEDATLDFAASEDSLLDESLDGAPLESELLLEDLLAPSCDADEPDGEAVASDAFVGESDADKAPECADPNGKADALSAAQLAESLDFHTDTVVRDGESYDPMTLAHMATGTRRPTAEDFMRPLGEGESARRG